MDPLFLGEDDDLSPVLRVRRMCGAFIDSIFELILDVPLLEN